jgi:outer membrane beta-barrel protein
MESRLQPVILTAALLCLAGLPASALAADPKSNDQVIDDIVKPDIQRRTIDDDKIDSEDFELGFYAGVMSVEDFGSNDVYGLRLAYHISESMFIEGAYGITQTQKTTAETLDRLVLLTDDQRELSYYSLNFGYNLLPGEHYVGRWAFNTNFYIVAGAGSTLFADEEYFTYNFGGGLRFFATDWLALHVDFRNYVFTHTLFGEDKKVQNLESSLGATLFF